LNENIGSIRSICIIRRGSTANALAIGTKSNYIISKDLGSEQFDAIMRVKIFNSKREFIVIKLSFTGTYKSIDLFML